MNPNFSLESSAEKIEPSLKALQVHYKAIIEKYQPALDHAHSQLTYIEGILSGLAVVSTKLTPVTTQKKFQEEKPTVLKSEEKSVSPKLPKASRKSAKVSNSSTSNSSKSLKFAPKYADETLTSAVEKILGDRRGKEVGIKEVVSVLYGNLDSEQFKVAKDRVTKNLSKGKVDGLWNRIPDMSGYYTAK